MSDYVELIRQLVLQPKELRVDETQAILFTFGYSIINSRGSHFRFKKKNFPSITIVVHHNKVKKWYIKDMCKILLAQLP